MSGSAPVFGVVGHVNKGKSSIVSTLAEDPSVAIDRFPRTTRYCRRYPIVVDERELFTLVDTPGFEQARAALAWMQERESEGIPRRDAVRRFVQTYCGSGDFEEECELLRPIIEGAGILYVVDGSQPFRRQYRAEMEVLQWTGQPRMALINTITDKDHTDTWRAELDQFFSIVRSFDAHKVGFVERIRLLRGMRELSEEWRAPLDEAIEVLITEWRRRRSATARIIADLLVEQLTFVMEEAVDEPSEDADLAQRLTDRFHSSLRENERQSRQLIEHLYKHIELQRDERDMDPPVWERDLFAEASWKLLGLTTRQLLWAGMATGAAAGGAIDAAVGGASFLTGALIGAAAGGATSLRFAAKRLASPKNVWRSLTGHKLLRIGPHKNPNFPWITLDRALLHWITIRDWAHARRETLHLDHDVTKAGLVSGLDETHRKELRRLFKRIGKKPRKVGAQERAELEAVIQDVVELLSAREEAALAAG